MMKMHCYTLRDIKADTFGNPIFVPNVGALLRDIGDVINDPKSDQVLSRHPRDFHLYRIGTFDNASGVFDLLPLPEFVLDVGGLAGGQEGSVATAAPAVSG